MEPSDEFDEGEEGLEEGEQEEEDATPAMAAIIDSEVLQAQHDDRTSCVLVVVLIGVGLFFLALAVPLFR